MINVSNTEVENIVRSVLSNMYNQDNNIINNNIEKDNLSNSEGKVALLTSHKKIEVKTFPLPEVKDDEILVKIDGCGICGTDVHEWKGDPFNLIPVSLGHEGTGTVIKLGKNITKDTAGKNIKLNDKIVTSVINCGKCNICRMHPNTTNLCENQGIYGLTKDTEENHFVGWFATHLLIKNGSTFFVVNDLNLEERMLLELAAVAVHALQRSLKTNIINFNSNVLIQGCGPVGLMMTAVLKVMGINKIICVDGSEERLNIAKLFGANEIINFKEFTSIESRISKVNDITNNIGVDFAFQCTGSPLAASDIYKYIRRGGGLCEMGFFVNNGEAKINPHFDICNKEINIVGSWVYSADEYPITISFLKEARKIGIPLEKMITHRYPLDKLNEAMEMNISLQGIKIAYVSD